MTDSNKRRGVRRQCALPFEIRTEPSAHPIKGQTSDVSPYGCYIPLLYTLAKDTTVDFVLWLGETPLSMRAKVVTADPSVGNGIEFLDVTVDMRAQLTVYLETVYLEKVDSNETGSSGTVFR